MTSAPVNSPLTIWGWEAVEALERALAAAPLLVGQEADLAVRLTVRLRDTLIDRLRRESTAAEAPHWQAALTRVNGVLSLIIGIEYPTSGIQRSVIEAARDALKEILDEGLL